jgi:hypothetical protein
LLPDAAAKFGINIPYEAYDRVNRFNSLSQNPLALNLRLPFVVVLYIGDPTAAPELPDEVEVGEPDLARIYLIMMPVKHALGR